MSVNKPGQKVIQQPTTVAKKEPVKQVAQTSTVKDTKPVDKATVKGPEKEVSNAGDLNPLLAALDPAKAEKAKEGEKVKDGEKTDEKNKTGDAAKAEKAKQIQQQLEKLQKELQAAQAAGDQKKVAALRNQIAGLQKELQGVQGPGGGTNAGGTPPAAGDDTGSNAGGNAGGAPAGGNNGGAPAGGAPAGGDASGGAPAGGAPGGGAPAGGANEAGAGQGAGAGKEEVDQFIQQAAAAYGTDPKVLSEIARRESNFNTGDIANNWDSNAKKGTPSKGMFQFIEPTFADMAPKAKAANPQAWAGVSENWTDWKAQALTTSWAIANGKGSHWSTFKSAVASAGNGNQGRMA